MVRKDSRGEVVECNTSHLQQSHLKGTGQTDSVLEQEETEVGQSNTTVLSKRDSVENDKEDFKRFEDSESVEESVHSDTDDFKRFTGCGTLATIPSANDGGSRAFCKTKAPLDV
ncbi:hypothetical protein PR048_016170 [Dryococelus australis]|uniref:Uncharacterized protein n=1 Tax=Dryococelus australis TaxID=614101 RepID=A0ABQ9HJ06_9NEOP|nr:hypothetical protein PR048_016170 [Dryococelus australis]